MAKAGIRPPFGSTDTDKFLWAKSWADDPDYEVLKVPRLGLCCCAYPFRWRACLDLRKHVRQQLHAERRNQSDAITSCLHFLGRQSSPSSGPRTAPAPPAIEPPADAMPVLRKGKYGQGCGLSADTAAKMGGWRLRQAPPIALVREFQRSQGLAVDGVVGEATWAALLDEEPPVKPPAPAEGGCIDGITATWFGGSSETEMECLSAL